MKRLLISAFSSMLVLAPSFSWADCMWSGEVIHVLSNPIRGISLQFGTSWVGYFDLQSNGDNTASGRVTFVYAQTETESNRVEVHSNGEIYLFDPVTGQLIGRRRLCANNGNLVWYNVEARRNTSVLQGVFFD